MSTDGNSLDYAKAKDALQGAMSPEALAAALAASWNKPKAADVAYTTPADAAVTQGASEPAALTFLAEYDSAPSPASTAPLLALVADNGAGTANSLEAVITDQDVEAIAAEVIQRCVAAGVSPADIDKILAPLKSNIGASKASLEDIRGAALKQAEDLATQATSKASESAADRKERLWKEAIKAEEKAQEESHELDPWKDPKDLAKENAAEKKYKEALDEYERLKASGASEAELEAARKRVQAQQQLLLDARKDSLQGVIDNPNTPPEIRARAQQAIEADAIARQDSQQKISGAEEQVRHREELHIKKGLIQEKDRTFYKMVTKGSAALNANYDVGVAGLESIIADTSDSAKPTTLAHADVGVLEATSASPNVHGGGRATGAVVVKT